MSHNKTARKNRLMDGRFHASGNRGAKARNERGRIDRKAHVTAMKDGATALTVEQRLLMVARKAFHLGGED